MSFWPFTSHRGGRILLHATIAAVFFFVLQRFGFGQSLETSLLWAAFFAIAAALLAWQQSPPR
jgi:hypothetical protein